jgi:general secretion pathway protein D
MSKTIKMKSGWFAVLLLACSTIAGVVSAQELVNPADPKVAAVPAAPKDSPSKETDSPLPTPPFDIDTPTKRIFDSARGNTVLDVLELRDMDIKDVLKLIAGKTGLNIVAGGNVSGRVTMFMQNVDVYDVLKIVLDANDLAFSEETGIVRVMSAAEYERIYGRKFGLQTRSKIIHLQGMRASDAVGLLQQMKSIVGKVIADEQSNTILIEDSETNLSRMVNYLQKIDAPTQTKVFDLRHVQAEEISKKILEMATPKLSTVRFDLPTNKLFVKDTKQRMADITLFIKEIDVPRNTRVFALSYAKAEDLSKTLDPILTPNIGSMEVDKRSNKIVVTDTPSKLSQMGDIISMLDVSDKEVLIEAKIVQIDLSNAYKMGIDWEALVSDYHGLDINSAMGGLASSPSKKGVISIGTLSDDKYTATLEALRTIGKTKVLSSPRVAVVNNTEASILVGTTKPYVTTTTTTPSSGPSTTAEAVSFIDVGVKLFVTPVIHNDGFVTMKIKPEVSSAATSIVTGNNNEIPIVDTSHVDTTIHVKDGVTIVIGGLIKEENVDTTNKVPLLGDIPVLGHAFRNTDQRQSTTEIVIFLTPHIITGDLQTTEKNAESVH